VQSVQQIPARDGCLMSRRWSVFMVRAHYEIQRLSEDFITGSAYRSARPLLAVLRAAGTLIPAIVDVGLRHRFRDPVGWQCMDKLVELMGPIHAALIAEAGVCAGRGLRCTFLVANAFYTG